MRKRLFSSVILSVIICLALIPIILFTIGSCEKKTLPMLITSPDTIVQKFYALNHGYEFWYSSKKSLKKANEWLTIIESAERFGLSSDKNQIEKIRVDLSNKNINDNRLRNNTDQLLTGLVLNFIKNLQQGSVKFDFDEVSIPHDSLYINQLLNSKKTKSASVFISRIECKNPDYLTLKKYLNDSLSVNDTLKYKAVLHAINYQRFLSINNQKEYVFVNIPETEAKYFSDGLLALKMKTVVGRKKSPTPTIASHITTIVTFPFWNVPHSIAVKEILPKVKKNEIYLEQSNLFVVDAKGATIDDSDLNWEDYTERNFPFFFRQATGAKNSLGVLKFNLNNPYSIFLHSTSNQSAFNKEYRYLSHGCIRLENPIILAERLLRGKLDVEELIKGKKDTESAELDLPQKVQVFIIYSPAVVIDNRVTFFDDVYGLIK